MSQRSAQVDARPRTSRGATVTPIEPPLLVARAEDLAWSDSAQVVVVGWGAAGACAALQARQGFAHAARGLAQPVAHRCRQPALTGRRGQRVHRAGQQFMQAPGLRLDAHMVLKPQRMLEQREIDLTFSCDEAVIQDFTSTPVFTDTILLAVPQDVTRPAHRAQYSLTAADILARRHLAPGCPSVDLKDFAAEPFILLRSGNNLHDRAMHFFRASGSEPRVKMELSQMATAYRLAEAGFAATFLSDRLITSAESRLRFYRLPHPESQRTFHALTNPKRYRSEAVHQFLCSLQSQSRFSKRKKYASSSCRED